MSLSLSAVLSVLLNSKSSQPTKRTKKVAIAASIGIRHLGCFLASPSSFSAIIVDECRLVQYDISGAPSGSRVANFNHHVGSLNFASGPSQLFSTADLLTWFEPPLTFISSQCGIPSLPHQPRHQRHLQHLPQIEERILWYRDESQRLDQCSRLYDSSVSNDAFEHEASRILQELGGIGTSIDRQHKLLRNQKTLRKTDEQLR
ncbi:hypothetical protein EV1_003387 [Malus domestica]